MKLNFSTSTTVHTGTQNGNHWKSDKLYQKLLLVVIQVLPLKGGNVAVKMMVMMRREGVNNEGLILSMSHWRKDDEGGLPYQWRGRLAL